MAQPYLMQKYRIPPEYERHLDAFLELAAERSIPDHEVNIALQFAADLKPGLSVVDLINDFENYASANGVAESVRDSMLEFYDNTVTRGVSAPAQITSESVVKDAKRLEELQGIMKQDIKAWSKNEKLNAEYHTLLERGERSVHATASNQRSATANANIERITELQTMLADGRSRYWKGTEAPALQKEYRNLLDQRDGALEPQQISREPQRQIAPAPVAAEGTAND